MEPQVVLRGGGTMDKLAAHQAPGHLHEAFSVLVFDGDRVLLQKRASTKYHFPGLWTNACCSHPLGDVVAEASARMQQELGATLPLEVVGSFTYRAEDVLTGLVEHEHDTVLVGYGAPDLAPEPTEVEDVRWVPLEVLHAELAERPDAFTPWLAGALACAREAGHPRG